MQIELSRTSSLSSNQNQSRATAQGVFQCCVWSSSFPLHSHFSLSNKKQKEKKEASAFQQAKLAQRSPTTTQKRKGQQVKNNEVTLARVSYAHRLLACDALPAFPLQLPN